jgi:hypothetical protein
MAFTIIGGTGFVGVGAHLARHIHGRGSSCRTVAIGAA